MIHRNNGPDFGAGLCGKNMIINKPLYGLKTSAARFHEHLAEIITKIRTQEN
jgi:hypothetical protein